MENATLNLGGGLNQDGGRKNATIQVADDYDLACYDVAFDASACCDDQHQRFDAAFHQT
jgi:hypothetical protein